MTHDQTAAFANVRYGEGRSGIKNSSHDTTHIRMALSCIRGGYIDSVRMNPFDLTWGGGAGIGGG